MYLKQDKNIKVIEAGMKCWSRLTWYGTDESKTQCTPGTFGQKACVRKDLRVQISPPALFFFYLIEKFTEINL